MPLLLTNPGATPVASLLFLDSSQPQHHPLIAREYHRRAFHSRSAAPLTVYPADIEHYVGVRGSKRYRDRCYSTVKHGYTGRRVDCVADSRGQITKRHWPFHAAPLIVQPMRKEY